jgi:hypothetical protein
MATCRHCEEQSDEAIQSRAYGSGLLRFARNDGHSESEMSKAAFDKIKAGLDEAKAYLDGSRDKFDYGTRIPEKKK